MAYTKAADGVVSKGKTKGKHLGNSGPTNSIEGGKGSAGVTSEAMRKVGRNLARVANQKKGG